MIVELVHVATTDGMRLDGALHGASSAGSLPLDALLCLHGVGGNFYGSSLFQRLTPPLLAAGLTILWANTRGHDAVHTARVTSGARRFGAAYEIVDECRFDVAAWLDLLRRRGLRRVGLLGHSLGAIKAVYAAAHEPDPIPGGVIAISPPRLSFSCFRQDSIARASSQRMPWPRSMWKRAVGTS